MTSIADLLTTVLARDLVEAERQGARVLAVTSNISLVAGLMANELGARLGLATGFGTLDAPARPSVLGGEEPLGTALSPVGPVSDTFAALAKGIVAVAVTPAQLDAHGATNLSRIGGSNEQPAVALPGSRGLPDNNDSPSRVWYLFGKHSPRSLVAEVDFVSGPPPSSDRERRLITPLGVFTLIDGGWVAASLSEGTTADDVAEATGFPIEVAGDCQVTPDPSPVELAALAEVDPLGIRRIDVAEGPEVARLFSEIAASESAGS